jgi:large subunit ribosomal protein L35
MGKPKNKKALLKRVKITGTGKVLKRKPNQGHFNAKASGSEKMRKRGSTHAPTENRKQYRALLPDHL